MTERHKEGKVKEKTRGDFQRSRGEYSVTIPNQPAVEVDRRRGQESVQEALDDELKDIIRELLKGELNVGEQLADRLLLFYLEKHGKRLDIEQQEALSLEIRRLMLETVRKMQDWRELRRTTINREAALVACRQRVVELLDRVDKIVENTNSDK